MKMPAHSTRARAARGEQRGDLRLPRGEVAQLGGVPAGKCERLQCAIEAVQFHVLRPPAKRGEHGGGIGGGAETDVPNHERLAHFPHPLDEPRLRDMQTVGLDNRADDGMERLPVLQRAQTARTRGDGDECKCWRGKCSDHARRLPPRGLPSKPAVVTVLDSAARHAFYAAQMLTRSRAAQLLNPAKRILVVGEMMLDEFIWGKVARISPEAPVPVVEVIRETFNAGGAANVARNLREFADHVHLLSLAGTGTDAETLRGLLETRGVALDGVIFDPAYTTIRKTRIVARHQQVVRVDREQRRGFTTEQRTRVLSHFTTLLPSLDAIILEDYDKGLIDQHLVDELISAARAAGKIVTVDPKPSNPIRWHDVTCVTPNRSEAFRAAGRPLSDPVEPALSDRALLEVGAVLLEKWRCDHVLITLSEQGMMLFDPGREPYHIPTRAQEVIDVSGAGDTAIAVLTAALASGASASEAAELANHASGLVVAKAGTAVATRAEVLESFPEHGHERVGSLNE